MRSAWARSTSWPTSIEPTSSTPSRCCSIPRTTRHGASTTPTSTSRTPSCARAAAGWIAAGGLVVALAAALTAGGRPAPAAELGFGVLAVVRSLSGPLLVAFELTAPLLLVAIVGAVVIWRRHEPSPRTAARPTRTAEPRRLVIHQ